MATLWQLRQDLMDEYGTDSPTATLVIDLPEMTYSNALRIQGWIGPSCWAQTCNASSPWPASSTT
jgi:hypothetical protein